MAKILIKGIIVFLFFTAILTTNVFAGFDEIYMTDAEGSDTEKTIFNWDETPWLYVKLPDSNLNVTVAFWESPNSSYYFTNSMGSNQEYWFSLDSGVDSSGNPVTWDDVKELGVWNINAGYFYAGGGSGEGTASFTVTPEPVSSILFIAGGAVLAGRRYLKRKRK